MACYRACVKIAVVIPALDEATQIQEAIASATATGVEVVVVDGGSEDATPQRARAAGARVLHAGRGRARQLRAGVEESESEVILFLHADTRLPPAWERAVRGALEDPEVVGGAFRLRFDERGLGQRVLEAGVRVRIAIFGLPYGDQALFVRRRVLDEIGGVPDVPVMEDLDLVVALKSRGRLAMLALEATSSARRYRERGLWRSAFANVLALLGWWVGLDRVRIASWLGR